MLNWTAHHHPRTRRTSRVQPLRYRKFLRTEPSLDEFEARLRSFARLDDEFQLIDASRQISALSLQAALGPNGAGLLNAACSAVDACGAVVARLRARGDGRGRCWERRGGSLCGRKGD